MSNRVCNSFLSMEDITRSSPRVIWEALDSMMARPLADGYSAEVDTVDAGAWYDHVVTLGDANLYQLWQHGANPARRSGVSALLLKRRGDLVAAAEARLFRLPLTKRGIAYVLWGPLWRPSPGGDSDVFRQAIRALRNEYVVRRGLILRLVPRLFIEHDSRCLQILSDEGLAPVGHLPSDKSLVMDLSLDLKDVRLAFDQKWRNCLNKAERAGLTLTAGTSLDLFDEFTVLHDQMFRRKRLAPTADIQKHRRIQEALPERLKMGVVLARHEGQPCAGAIYSAIGDTAVYLFGAIDEAGMRTSGSYLVQWHVLTLLKQRGVTHYDLNGIDPDGNPGVYHFKKGLAGRKATEVTFLGQFQALDASLTNQSLLLVDRLRHKMETARSRRAGARP